MFADNTSLLQLPAPFLLVDEYKDHLPLYICGAILRKQQLISSWLVHMAIIGE
jgi:hypothetical protein